MYTTGRRAVLPGFRLSLGYSVFYLSLVVLIPLSMLLFRTAGMGLAAFCEAAFDARALAAYRLTFGCSLAAALVNVVFGSLVAWVLVRYRFAGRRIVDALVDLPFALPTAVTGIALTALYAPGGPLGRILYGWGIESAYSPLGITLALVFVGFPFVVRTLQPVIEELDSEYEEAAASLGAGRGRTFVSVILPNLLPAMLTGFTLAFARSVGEYGSVIFIAGNMPGRTEIAPLLIMTRLEQYDYAGASAIALVMLVFSLLFLGGSNWLQRMSLRRIGAA